jgi:ribosome-binding protein aMBF1 (putative translation factor)
MMLHQNSGLVGLSRKSPFSAWFLTETEENRLRGRESRGKIQKNTAGGTSMAKKKVGTLIKEARTAAGMTQEQLARKIAGLSATDISEAERGKKDLTQDQLKKIAKATGITQASLLNAAKGSTTAKKTSTAAKSSMQVTAAERKLVELYRAASTEDKKQALKVLKGEDSLTGDIMESLLGSLDGDKILDTLLDSVQDAMKKK